MKNYKVLIPKLVIYFLALKITAMFIIMTVDRKQIRKLKDDYQESINTIDSLYRSNIDPSVIWFENQVPDEYKEMEHATMNYDWGKEIVVFFKYTN